VLAEPDFDGARRFGRAQIGIPFFVVLQLLVNLFREYRDRRRDIANLLPSSDLVPQPSCEVDPASGSDSSGVSLLDNFGYQLSRSASERRM
jgi:hypothetical protein